MAVIARSARRCGASSESDEAIQFFFRQELDCFATRKIGKRQFYRGLAMTEHGDTGTFKLRPYVESDQEPSIALWLATWKLAYPSIDFDARVDWWRKRWRDELVPNAVIIVADSGDQLAGFVTIDPSGYLDQFVVAPAHWGSPLATALLDEAKRLSPDGVTLKVNADNVRAIRFYTRNGFIDVGEDTNPGSNRPVRKMAWEPTR